MTKLESIVLVPLGPTAPLLGEPRKQDSLARKVASAVLNAIFVDWPAVASDIRSMFVNFPAAFGNPLPEGWVQGLGVFGPACWTIVGLVSTYTEGKRFYAAWKNEDKEGKRDAAVNTVAMAVFFVTGVLSGLASDVVCNAWQWAKDKVGILGPASVGCLLAFYTLLLGAAAYACHYIRAFRSEVLGDLGRGGEKFVQIDAAFERLLDEIAPKCHASQDDIELARRFLPERLPRFERRVGKGFWAELELDGVDLLGPLDTAQKLAILKKVDGASLTQLARNITMVAIAVLGIAASVLILAGTGGAAVNAVPALFAISAVMWLPIDSTRVQKVVFASSFLLRIAGRKGLYEDLERHIVVELYEVVRRYYIMPESAQMNAS